MTRLSHRNTTQRLRAAIERRCKVRHWGSDYTVTPRLVSEVFGDGRQLIWLQPLNTRPNYYVVRIDSAWNRSNLAQEGDVLCDHLDEIYDAIDDEYGRAHKADEDECRDFPALDLDAGCAWGEQEWPTEMTSGTLATR